MGTLASMLIKLGLDTSEYTGGLDAAAKQTGGFVGSMGAKLASLGSAAVIGGVAVAGAAVAGIGAFAWKSANELDGAYDAIQVSTGATGKELDVLSKSFENVFTSVPTDAETAAGALAELSKRTGATGADLEGMTAQLLESSRLLGGDATKNAGMFARVMGDWGIPVEEGSAALDKLFKAGQLTGVSMESLMGKVVQFGSPMRLMGFSIDEAVGLFAKWEKEGVNAELVMGSLRIAAGKFADAGKPLKESLLETFDAIQNNEDASEALGLAMEVFGARAGPDMAAAIREGRFAVDDLVAALGDSEGAIMSTGAATMDWGEKVNIFKNKAGLAFAPLGGMMMDLASKALDGLTPAIDTLSVWLGVNLPIAIAILSDFWTNTLQPAIATVWSWMSTVLIPFLQNVVLPWLQVNIPKALQFLSDFWTNVLQPAIATVWNWMSTVLIPFLQNTVFPWLQENIPAAIQTLSDFWTNTLQPAIEAVWTFLTVDMMPIWEALGELLEVYVANAIEALVIVWNEVLQPALTAVWKLVKDSLSPAMETLKTIFENIEDPISKVANFISDVAAAIGRLDVAKLLSLLGIGKGGSGGISGRALGGPVMAGSAYLVGEVGPELFVPRSSGHVVPNGQFQGAQVVNHYETYNLNGSYQYESQESIVERAKTARRLRG